MNLYFIVEGETEKKIYRSWLSHVFPSLRFVGRAEDVTEDCIRLLSGKGYPQYLNLIDEIIEEIAGIVQDRVDHLFVCVDSEELSFEERHQEVTDRISQRHPPYRWSVIIQNCCIETWLLGNQRFFRPNPQRERLRGFKGFYDVSQLDPEKMGWHPEFQLRASFHFEYLREMIRDRSPRLSYTKKKPGPTTERSYLRALADRHRQTDHIQSFGQLVAAWRQLGAEI